MTYTDVQWIVQTNLLNRDQIEQMLDALIDHNIPYLEATVIPFSDEITIHGEVTGTHVIPYGSVKFHKLAQLSNWDGMFFDHDRFAVGSWNAHRDDMLNADAKEMTVAAAQAYCSALPDQSELFFIRPVHDLKAFQGSVTSAKEIAQWMSSTESGNFSFEADTLVVLASPKHIRSEMRFFVVGGTVVSGSYYRSYGQMYQARIQPQDSEFIQAQALADGWLPHPCCVMDVAVSNGELKVVEFNTFNSSGFYDHDVEAIVLAASKYVQEL